MLKYWASSDGFDAVSAFLFSLRNVSKKIASVFLTVCFFVFLTSIAHASAATNLVTNPGAETGDASGWSNIVSGGNGWDMSSSWDGQIHSGTHVFRTSYGWGSMDQTIDLVAAGYSTTTLDGQPDILFSDWVSTRCANSSYYITYQLLRSDHSVLATSGATFGTDVSPATVADSTWTQKSYAFSGYGTGARYAYVKQAGVSSCGWAGYYGPHFDDVSVTVGNNTNPSAALLRPANGSTNVATSTAFEIDFDEDVATSTGNAVLYRASDNAIVETIDLTGSRVTASSTNGLIIRPSASLVGGTMYYVLIDSGGIKDLAGHAFAGIAASTTWRFTTIDTTNPTLSSRSPLVNAVDVGIDANVTMTFSEAVQAGTGSVGIYNASTHALVEAMSVTGGRVSGTGTAVITIDPASTLAYGTAYEVLVDATAFRDLSGNNYAGITSTGTWVFTTANAPTCPTIAHAASYHAYPTCGVAACENGYDVIGGACVASGGGAYVPPPSMGNGLTDHVIPMNETKVVGDLPSSGINLLSYIHSHAEFNAVMSGTHIVQTHHMTIADIDMTRKTITVDISSIPTRIQLNVGEMKQADLDGDGIADIAMTYNHLLINRVDLTVTPIDSTVSSALPIEQTAIAHPLQPAARVDLLGGLGAWDFSQWMGLFGIFAVVY